MKEKLAKNRVVLKTKHCNQCKSISILINNQIGKKSDRELFIQSYLDGLKLNQ